MSSPHSLIVELLIKKNNWIVNIECFNFCLVGHYGDLLWRWKMELSLSMNSSDSPTTTTLLFSKRSWVRWVCIMWHGPTMFTHIRSIVVSLSTPPSEISFFGFSIYFWNFFFSFPVAFLLVCPACPQALPGSTSPSLSVAVSWDPHGVLIPLCR